MSYGRVCAVHNQWCPDGVCKYCEPLPDSWAMPGYDLLPVAPGWMHGREPARTLPELLIEAGRAVDEGRPAVMTAEAFKQYSDAVETMEDPKPPGASLRDVLQQIRRRRATAPAPSIWAGLGTASAALQHEQAERVAQAKADAVAKGRALRCDATACGYRCDNPDGHEGMHRFGAPRP